MNTTGADLEKHWRAAAGRPVTATRRFRTIEIDVHTPQGPMLIALDSTGGRHFLLPLASRHTVRPDLDGRAVHFKVRTLEDQESRHDYADLELKEPRLTDLFTSLCAEIVRRVERRPDRALALTRTVLAEWRALLASASGGLTPSALAGLFGELMVLRRMLERDPGAAAFWRGPFGSAQDFHRGADALEVKTTTAVEGRTVRIHGLDQFDVAESGRLRLCWFRLRTDRGMSVPSLVDEVLGLSDDPDMLRKTLLAARYRDADRVLYEERLFEVLEQRSYRIGPGFPRITAAGLVGDARLAGVGPVEYIVDLDSGPADAMRTEDDPVPAWLEGR